MHKEVLAVYFPEGIALHKSGSYSENANKVPEKSTI
jgi:hypothetical protein